MGGSGERYVHSRKRAESACRVEAQTSCEAVCGGVREAGRVRSCHRAHLPGRPRGREPGCARLAPREPSTAALPAPHHQERPLRRLDEVRNALPPPSREPGQGPAGDSRTAPLGAPDRAAPKRVWLWVWYYSLVLRGKAQAVPRRGEVVRRKIDPGGAAARCAGHDGGQVETELARLLLPAPRPEVRARRCGRNAGPVRAAPRRGQEDAATVRECDREKRDEDSGAGVVHFRGRRRCAGEAVEAPAGGFTGGRKRAVTAAGRGGRTRAPGARARGHSTAGEAHGGHARVLHVEHAWDATAVARPGG
mmetsp:Transcript_19528/g.48996  ORF Transcript_19528/g.48996 Transcript_19528/m.48996 type:complete len:306 (+) Transcript_19528:1864-2781(+)